MNQHYTSDHKLAPVQSTVLELPGLSHGFFTRRGGDSNGLYSSLNAGQGSHDEADLVSKNRARIAGHLGVAPSHLLSPYQFHSCEVAIVKTPFSGDRPRADAIVTAEPGMAIGVVTADCGPVLFVDITAGVIGAAHAGWQGAGGGVLEQTITAMESIGAKRANMISVLGPTIGLRNYEVGADFEAKLTSKDTNAAGFFFAGKALNKRQFDLPGYIMARLARAEVAAFNSAICTYADAERFFSYRRATHQNEADYGRQMSALVLE